MFAKVHSDRINKSLKAAEKWLDNREPNKELLQEAWRLYLKLDEKWKNKISDSQFRDVDVVHHPGEWTKEKKLTFWAFKVYNGMLYKVNKEWVWG